MDEEANAQNTMAMVSAGAGAVGVIALLLNCCIGFIPIVNMLGIIIFPVALLANIIAIITGILGFRTASETGVGKEMAMGGIAAGTLSFLLYFGLCGLAGIGGVIATLSSGY